MNHYDSSGRYFRVANNEDVDMIVALVDSAYRGESSRCGWTTEADLLDGQRTDAVEVSGLMNKENSYIILCESDHTLLSSLYLAKEADYGYLGMFAVEPKMQGQGIGKQIMTEAERIVFQDWNFHSIQMSVISLREDLIAWYERCGYYRTREFKPFPYGKPQFGIPKRDDLRLEVLRKDRV